MIIRSQDKKHTSTDMNLKIETNKYFPEVEDEDVIIESQIYNSVGWLLGVYSTEEKAIKVLDDICAFANGLHFEKIATDQCGRLDGVVFQMPQDSEV